VRKTVFQIFISKYKVVLLSVKKLSFKYIQGGQNVRIVPFHFYQQMSNCTDNVRSFSPEKHYFFLFWQQKQIFAEICSRSVHSRICSKSTWCPTKNFAVFCVFRTEGRIFVQSFSIMVSLIRTKFQLFLIVNLVFLGLILFTNASLSTSQKS